MARPLRIEYAGALYHVTARGNARGDIYRKDIDRLRFLELLSNASTRYNWRIHAYCLMDNHYHLVIETVDDTLSKGMKYLNGTYSQHFNREHNRVGHVFQGRFKAILVQKEAYLLELCRYVVLNPVRARMVKQAQDWQWSNYQATNGIIPAASWLDTTSTLSLFGASQSKAQAAYAQFVTEGMNKSSPWAELTNQIYLGSKEFIEESQNKLKPDQSLKDIPNLQKSAAPKPLADYASKYPQKEAMARAYVSGHYTLENIGVHFGRSISTVSRAVKAFENSQNDKWKA